MHRSGWRAIGVLGALLALAAPLGAQDHPAVERGYSVDKLYQLADLDSVNLLNGAVSVRIPIGGAYPAGGSLSYQLNLVYSSKLWDFEEVIAQSGYLVRSLPARHTTAGFGWTLSLGRLLPPEDPANETPNWQYLDPMGGRHGLYSTLHPFDAVDTGVNYSRDSTYLRMTLLANGNRTLELPDGQIHTFNPGGLLTRIEDRFGNYLAVAYPDVSTWTLSDGKGRTHTVTFQAMVSDGQQVMVVDKVELAAFDGATATYDFTYESTMVAPAHTDTFHSPTAKIEVPLLTRVDLPDGSAFVPTYYLVNYSYGLLESLTLPTLGQIVYDWTFWNLPTEGCSDNYKLPWAAQTHGVRNRRFVDASGTEVGRWQYEQLLSGPPDEPSGYCTGTSLDPSEVSSTKVTTPLGDYTYYYFGVWPNFVPTSGSPNGFQVYEYGLPFDRTKPDATGTRYLSSESYDCSGSSCTLERSTYVRYEYESPCAYNMAHICDESNRRLASQRTVYHDDADRYADETFSDFDGLGRYRTMTTGGNFPAGNVRTTSTQYNPGHDLVLGANFIVQPGYVMWPASDKWVLGTFTEQTVSEGSATAKTQSCFDPDTGFLERRRVMKGTDPDANDVLAVFTAGTAGANKGHLRFEAYYGGDAQTLDTSTELCDLSPPATAYRLAHTYVSGALATSRYTENDGTDLGFTSVNLTIDAGTGLVAASQDPAGVVTDFEYDTMGRMQWEKPASGHGAWAQYAYHRAVPAAGTEPAQPAYVQIIRRANGSETGTILAQAEVWFDDFGRVWKERRLMPGIGWVERETLYDGMGHKKQVSEWAVEGAQQHWTKYLDYDARGRPRTIRPPDGGNDGEHDVTLIYAGDRVIRRKVKVGTARTAQGLITETTAETIERYDRQGRLYQVVEPSGDSGANVTTTYTYDVGNRLSQVSTTAAGTTQIRSFTYDHRGFLLSEEHPEKDGTVTYSGYDARGHAGGKVDGGHDLTFTYDRAERLLEVAETGGRPLKSFTYATTNAADNLRKGKLETATRYNYYSFELPPPPEQIFVDDFECGNLLAWSAVVKDGALPAPPPKSGCAPVTYTVAVAETYAYGGGAGRVSQRNLAITLNGSTGETFTQSWTYNDLGDVATVTYPTCTFSRCTSDGAGTARTVSPTYTRGFLTAVPGFASTITYHPSGLINTITHTNGVVATYGEDPHAMARPASITAVKGTTTYWSTGTYGYDGAGNVTEIGSAYYLYDEVSRLTTGALPTDRLGTGSLKTQSYTFDAFGNIQSIGGSPGRSTPTDSATNQLTGTAAYDAAGNLTSWNGNAYEYDALNMMTRMTSGAEDWLYVYTADDERVWQLKLAYGPAFHRYTLRDLSGQVLREYTAVGDFWTAERDYVLRGGRLLAAATPAGVRHFHLDHLGTPRLITNASGQWVAYHAYYPFGEEATNAFQDEERLKFTGHERDLADASGTADDLDYMHARHCSPLTGRFMSPDSVGGSAKTPQSWNRYSYSLNNPVNYVDPTGSIVKLGIETADTEDPLFQVFIAALKEARASNHEISSLTLIKSGDSVVLDTGSVDFTKSSNPTVKLLGEAIETETTVLVRIADVSGRLGGAVTDTTFFDSHNLITIRLDPEVISGLLVPGEIVSGSLEGQRVALPVSLPTALIHEIGHARGNFLGQQPARGGDTVPDAMKAENDHRRLGPVPAIRTKHCGIYPGGCKQ